MIKKFNEYIGEGFWKQGVNRAKSNEKRMENKYTYAFISENDLHKVKGFEDYYISCYMHDGTLYVYIYHEPNQEYIELAKCSDYKHGCHQIMWTDDLNFSDFCETNDGVTDEEFDTIYTEEFVDAANETIRELYK